MNDKAREILGKLEVGTTYSGVAVICRQYEEIERLNNIIKHTDSWLDRTIEIIKQQPSEDDTWILERLNGIKQCLKGSESND